MTTRTLLLTCGLSVCLSGANAEEGPVLMTARGKTTTQVDGVPLNAADSERQVVSPAPTKAPHQLYSDLIRDRVDVAELIGRKADTPSSSSSSITPLADSPSPMLRVLPAKESTPAPDALDESGTSLAPVPQSGRELQTESAAPQMENDLLAEDHADADEPEVEVELPAEIIALRDRIHRVLDHHYQRPLDAGRNDVWEVMHSFLAYGVDGRVRTSQYREPVNAIGWVCWNRPCKGKQLFQVRAGKLEAKQGPGVQGHHGQFLAMLAQCFVSPEYEIHVDGQAFTVQDLIEFEKETCYPKTELTFKLIAFSYYLPIDATWQARDGREWNLERLLQEELAQNVVGAACGGTHRLAGIGFAVQKRRASGLPMDGVWAKAEEYMERYRKYTFSLQNRDGSFSTSWFEQRGMDPSIERRLQTTGHILECMLLTSDDEILANPRVLRAVDYLSRLMEANPRQNWSIGPQGHALSALAIFDRRAFGTQPGHRNQQQQVAQAGQGLSR
ncbi:MAG: hypothetical protein WDZ51_03585 [Pirellulaceae bacterium]